MCSIRKAAALFAVLNLPISVYCQSKISSALIQRDTSFSRADTLGLISGRLVQGPAESRKSPSLAILLSAIVPGAGQIYTERYLHVPVVWGLGYHLVRQWKKGDELYRDYGGQFSRSVAVDTSRHLGNDQLRYIRDFYHDERDRFGLYIAILYFINIIDAYVGASLYNFEVSDELGGSAAIRFRIPVR